jgi:hypothetical protein
VPAGLELDRGADLLDGVVRLTTGARELLEQLPPAAAMRRWMDLFGDWIATKNGMLDTLLAMIESGEIASDRHLHGGPQAAARSSCQSPVEPADGWAAASRSPVTAT